MSESLRDLWDSIILNWAASLFLLVIFISIIAAIIAFIMSIKEQKAYDNDVLPSLPGMEDFIEDEVIDDLDEESMFHFEDEDDSLPDLPIGDSEANDLLKGIQAATASNGVKAKRKLFGRK